MPWWTQPFEDLAKIANNITQIITQPCAISPAVFVDTAFEAAMRMVVTVVEPSPKEEYHTLTGESTVGTIKRFLGGEHVSYSRGHGGGRSRVYFGGTDAEIIAPVAENYGKKFLFRGLEVADMAIWYLFLASITAEGLLDWTSQLSRLSGCNPADLYGESTEPRLAIHSEGAWESFSWAVGGGAFAPVWGGSLTMDTMSYVTISGSAAAKDVHGTPVSLQSRIRNDTAGHVISSNAGDPRHGLESTHRNMVWSQQQPSGRWQTETISLQFMCAESLPLNEAFANGGEATFSLRQGVPITQKFKYRNDQGPAWHF